MATHLDLEEQEQLDQLKHFWNTYGTLSTWTVLLVAGAFVAWNGWQYFQRNKAVQAAALYDEVERTTQAGDVERIQRVLADMKDRFGMAIMLITHAMGVVAETCQRVVVMYAGRVVEEAPVEALFGDPRHPYTQGLIRSIPRVDRAAIQKERLEAIPGTVPSLLDPPPGCRFAQRCKFAMDVCRQEIPLKEVGPGHFVRCLL